MQQQQIRLAIIIIATIVSILIIINKPVKLGLDLKGGVRVMLEAQTSKDVPVITPDIMEAFRTAIERRVNALGVAETSVQIVGNKRLMIELPDVKDPQKAKEYIGQTAKLEFKKLKEGTNLSESEWVDTGVTGKDLQKASLGTTQAGSWEINFRLNATGAKKFGDLTRTLVGKPLAIFFNGKLVSSPTVQNPITEGAGVITGDFTYEKARDMVDLMNAGALPVAGKIIEENTVGPTLGIDSIDKSLFAGYLGIGLVALFMLGYYRLPGLVADAALVLYALFVFAIFKAVPVTLTLAGIAGFILSIGMAVDANILIFERTKEELRMGRTLFTAIKTGFDRAFTSIFDSNMTTLISCAFLFFLGTGIVKGFALTLAIGVLVSMLTAITVTQSFLQLVCGFEVFKNSWLYGVKAEEIAQVKTFEDTLPERAKRGVLKKR